LVTNRPFKYPNGRSHVIYIGTTGNGASRPAASAVSKATEMFGEMHGVKQIDVHVVTCGGRNAVRTWQILESALLTAFRDIYFELPLKNKKRERKVDVDRYFNEKNLKSFIRRFEQRID